jgi:hypothetical protein
LIFALSPSLPSSGEEAGVSRYFLLLLQNPWLLPIVLGRLQLFLPSCNHCLKMIMDLDLLVNLGRSLDFPVSILAL